MHGSQPLPQHASSSGGWGACGFGSGSLSGAVVDVDEVIMRLIFAQVQYQYAT
jgi:hypothetical protein